MTPKKIVAQASRRAPDRLLDLSILKGHTFLVLREGQRGSSKTKAITIDSTECTTEEFIRHISETIDAEHVDTRMMFRNLLLLCAQEVTVSPSARKGGNPGRPSLTGETS